MGQFCYHDKFSDTMAVVLKEVIGRLGPHAEVLDIPAGAGRLSDRLRKHGFHVVSADINQARDDYCFSDMNKPLPFADGRFDAVISMEGIEHIIDYHGFIGELSRVTKQNGLIFLTTPNISCFYSRLMFICTGNFFQFWPGQAIVNVKGEGVFDYGHISPLTWQQICFRFAHYGATPIALRGNKVKRKILLPVYVPFMLIGLPWIAYRLRRTRKGVKSLLGQTDYYRKVEKLSYSLPAMFSRNIVIVLEKKRQKD